MAVTDYCTIAEIKAAIQQDADSVWGTDYDTILTAIATRASRAVDLYTNRAPGAYANNTAETRYFDGSGTDKLWVDEMAAAPASVAVAETGLYDHSGDTGGTYTTWAAADYVLWPYNAVDRGEPFTRLDVNILNGTKVVWYKYPKAVKISAKFGYSTTTPDAIKAATIIEAVRLFKRGQQGYEDTGAIVELGQLVYRRALDPQAELTLKPFIRTTI